MATLMDKYYNVRIKLRNDSWTNWESKQDFVPYDGEVIIYDIPTLEEKRKYGLDTLNYQIIKIGDGVKTLKELPAINEMTSVLNITTGSENGTISVSGKDVYVKGLNNSEIMCFERQDKYQTVSDANAIKDQISKVALNLQVLQVSTAADIEALRSLINNGAGGSASKIEEIEAKIIAEESQRQAADETILTEVEKNQASLQAVSNSIAELNTSIISEAQARKEKDNSLQNSINELTSSIDSLEESFDQLGEAGIVSLREGEGSYELLQNDVVVGTIVLPQDTYLIEGRVVKKINGEITLELELNNEEVISIPLNDLINNYGVQQSAEKVQLHINDDNIISASLVANSITSADIANNSILESSLSPEVRLKLNSTGSEDSGASQEQLAELKTYVDNLINAESGVQEAQYGENNKNELKHGDSFVVPKFYVNAQGKIEEAGSTKLYLPNLSYGTGTINGTIMINNEDVAVRGLKSAAYTEANNYDASGSANSALTSAKKYADDIKESILDGVESSYNTLKKLKIYIDNNSNGNGNGSIPDNVIEELFRAIDGKADEQHSHDLASETADGFMSSEDKAKLNNLAAGSVTEVIAGAGLLSDINSGKVTLDINTNFTTSGKNYAVKIDDNTGGLYVNVPSVNNISSNAFGEIKVGTTAIIADTTMDTLTLVAGENVTITPDAANDKITIAATNSVYTHPTTFGYKHIPDGGQSGQILRWSARGEAKWDYENIGNSNDTDTTYEITTGDSDGQIKVAPSNGNSYNVSVKGLGSAAYTDSDTYAVKQHGHDEATIAKSGFMSKEDKLRLDNLASGAIVGITAGPGLTSEVSSGSVTLAVNTDFITSTSEKNYAVKIDGNTGGLYVNVPWIKGEGTVILNGTATTSANFYAPIKAGTSGQYLKSNGSGTPPSWVQLNPEDIGAAPASHNHDASELTSGIIAVGRLPVATTSNFGAIKVGNNISVSSGIISLKQTDIISALGYTPPTSDTNTTYTISKGDSNGQIKVIPSSGYEYNVTITGLKSAAYTDSNAYEPAGEAERVKNELLNGAGDAYDTLKELGDLIDTNNDAIEALRAIATGKADEDHTHNYAGSSYSGGPAYLASGLGDSINAFTVATNNTTILNALANGKQQWALEKQSSTENGLLVHYYDASGNWTAQKHLWQEGDLITGAVWNDYAEYRSQNEIISPGYVTYCEDDGKLKKTTERLQKFEGVVSDTFGFAIGETEESKTPLAVSGRVLVYGNKEDHFHSGDVVCAGPNGMVYKMTRDEIAKFPDRIVGIVSEIPIYENWGTSNVKVNGRIWIKVR